VGLSMEQLSGFLLINKPRGVTSFDCVAHIRRLIGQGRQIRVGHAGTLDPFATGLLIIGIDRGATRCFSKLSTLDKVYEAIGKLGELTDTLDHTGQVLRFEHCIITSEQLQQMIVNFGRSYDQIPPIYSALKYQGNSLYSLVRDKRMPVEGLMDIVQKKVRCVELYELVCTDIKMPFFTIRAHVSHGTYMRSLVNDIAHKMDSCATVYELHRTAIGPFNLSESTALEQIQDFETLTQALIPVDTILLRLEAFNQCLLNQEM
jgi:tRNA pseudouridine55 synthase